jgi:deazaflavin-dependent oxidoreductase (nitroreductase family)
MPGDNRAKKRYNPFHLLIQRLASTPAGARLVAPILHSVDGLVLRLSGGRASLTGLLAGAPVVVVTMTGAKSGLPRTLPLLCIRDEQEPGTFALIATNFGRPRYPAWYFNLRANPRAVCAVNGKKAEYLAHEASAEEYERFWCYAAQVFQGYTLYKERVHGRRIPIVVMRRTEDG